MSLPALDGVNPDKFVVGVGLFPALSGHSVVQCLANPIVHIGWTFVRDRTRRKIAVRAVFVALAPISADWRFVVFVVVLCRPDRDLLSPPACAA